MLQFAAFLATEVVVFLAANLVVTNAMNLFSTKSVIMTLPHHPFITLWPQKADCL